MTAFAAQAPGVGQGEGPRGRAGRVPTARLAGLLSLTALVVLAVGALLPAVLAGPAATALLTAALVVAVVDAWRAPRSQDLAFSRAIGGPLRLGRPALVRLRLAWQPAHSTRATTVFWTDGAPVAAVDHQPHGRLRLAAGGPPACADYPLLPRRRGPVDWSGPLVAAPSPLGLWRTVVHAGGRTTRTVYPGASAAASAPGDRFAGRAPGAGDAGLEFDGVRPYLDGEDARRIHWRASARREQPVVRLLRPERGRRLLLAVDAGRWSGQTLDASGITRLDAFAAAALEVAAAALAAGDAVGLALITASGPVQTLAPRPGAAALSPLANALARTSTQDADPDAVAALAAVARAGADAVLWFTELPSAVDGAEWLRRLPTLARRLPLAVVSIRSAPPAEAEADPALAAAAAAAELAAARLQALTRLRRAGVRVWDGPRERCGALALAAYYHGHARGAAR